MISMDEFRDFCKHYDIAEKNIKYSAKEDCYTITYSVCGVLSKYYNRRPNFTLLSYYPSKTKEIYSWRWAAFNNNNTSRMSGQGFIRFSRGLTQVKQFSIDKSLNKLSKNINPTNFGYFDAPVNTIDELYSYMEMNIKNLKAIRDLSNDQQFRATAKLYNDELTKLRTLSSNIANLSKKLTTIINKKQGISNDFRE